jgi:hypothetical protein
LRHPMMAQAKAAYHARMPGQLDTFHALEQFCGTFIASIRREDCNVAATTTVANGQNRGGSGGGQGRGSGGRGRGSGRGGAGRGGRGRGSGGKKSVAWVPIQTTSLQKLQ